MRHTPPSFDANDQEVYFSNVLLSLRMPRSGDSCASASSSVSSAPSTPPLLRAASPASHSTFSMESSESDPALSPPDSPRWLSRPVANVASSPADQRHGVRRRSGLLAPSPNHPFVGNPFTPSIPTIKIEPPQTHPKIVITENLNGTALNASYFGLENFELPVYYIGGRLISVHTGPWTHQVKDSNLLPLSVIRVHDAAVSSGDFVIARLVCDSLYRKNGLVFLGAAPCLYRDEQGCVVLPSLKITKNMLPGRTKGFDFRVLFTYMRAGVETEHVISASFAIWANAYQSGFPLQEHSKQIEKRTQINKDKKRKPSSPRPTRGAVLVSSSPKTS